LLVSKPEYSSYSYLFVICLPESRLTCERLPNTKPADFFRLIEKGRLLYCDHV
jgi:hypothetical protein